MDFQALLGKTKASFSTHQSTGNRYHYPDSLKRDAVTLLKHYPPQLLSREFCISVKSLRNWQVGDQATKTESTRFVPLKLTDDNQVACIAPLPPHSITLKLPHNLELILPEKSIEESVQFVCRFIEEFSRCSI
jgi:hypothetical protein